MSVYTAKKTEGLKNFFLSYTTVVSFDRLSAKGEKPILRLWLHHPMPMVL